MKIQAICKTGIALVTNLEELSSRGICTQTINSQNTADMIRQSFAQLGMETDGMIDVETYINGQAVLIFAHIFKDFGSIALLCRFDDLENLINAAWQLCEKIPATLISHKQTYYLAIHCCDQSIPAELLSEYSDVEPNPKLRYAHLREHGKVICSGNAIKAIRENFRPNYFGVSFSRTV